MMQTNVIIQSLIDSPIRPGMILDRQSSLFIPEEVGRIVTLPNPKFPEERYELPLYGHTEDFERFSFYNGQRRKEVLATTRLKERRHERPILVCTKDGRIFLDSSLRHKDIPYKEYLRLTRSIPNELRRFKEMFDILAA